MRAQKCFSFNLVDNFDYEFLSPLLFYNFIKTNGSIDCKMNIL